MMTGQSGERLSTVIIETVAEREGVSALVLPEPLYETIDPEALGSLFQDSSGQATFYYLDYRVTVDHEHNVAVTATEDH